MMRFRAGRGAWCWLRLIRVRWPVHLSGKRRPQPANQHDEARFHPVIHAGDRLTVEEHTAVADAALEARALNPAARGSALEVRLAIGGRVVRAVALGPGRAAFQREIGGRP